MGKKRKKLEWFFYLPVHKKTGDIELSWITEALQYPEDEYVLKDEYYQLTEDWEWRPMRVTFKELKDAEK